MALEEVGVYTVGDRKVRFTSRKDWEIPTSVRIISAACTGSIAFTKENSIAFATPCFYTQIQFASSNQLTSICGPITREIIFPDVVAIQINVDCLDEIAGFKPRSAIQANCLFEKI